MENETTESLESLTEEEMRIYCRLVSDNQNERESTKLEVSSALVDKVSRAALNNDIASRDAVKEGNYDRAIKLALLQKDYFRAADAARRAGYGDKAREYSTLAIKDFEERGLFNLAASEAKKAGFEEETNRLYELAIEKAFSAGESGFAHQESGAVSAWIGLDDIAVEYYKKAIELHEVAGNTYGSYNAAMNAENLIKSRGHEFTQLKEKYLAKFIEEHDKMLEEAKAEWKAKRSKQRGE
jgi:hypothetical protein